MIVNYKTLYLAPYIKFLQRHNPLQFKSIKRTYIFFINNPSIYNTKRGFKIIKIDLKSRSLSISSLQVSSAVHPIIIYRIDNFGLLELKSSIKVCRRDIVTRPHFYPVTHLDIKENITHSDRLDQNKSRKDLDVIRSILGYLWPKRQPLLKVRIIFALGCLILAKLLNIQVPIFFKEAVDALNHPEETPNLEIGLSLFTGAGTLLLGYGIARVLASFFNELRNALFAKKITCYTKGGSKQRSKTIEGCFSAFAFSRPAVASVPPDGFRFPCNRARDQRYTVFIEFGVVQHCPYCF
jgi:hypothetical protein